MNITVNGKSIEFEGKTVANLLEQLGFSNSGYAVAVGSQIIARDEHSTYTLEDGNAITIIVATHGG